MSLVEILKNKIDTGINPPKIPTLYEKLIEKIEVATPNYIISNKKSDIDLLIEKLDKVIITNNIYEYKQ